MRRSSIILVTCLAVVLAACGQKSGVHVAASAASSGGAAASGGGDLTTGSGDGSDLTGGASDGTAASSSSGSGTGTGTGTKAGTTGSGGTATKAGTVAASGPVWGDTVTIGIHAPLTGAAPLPAASFEKGKDLYVNYINGKGGINGRKLAVEFEDDEYQPATAVSKCKQLVEQKHAFLLFGAAGTDQIQACAQYAAAAHVPYVSAGVTEVGLRGLRYYFAGSMSYPQQAPMLARYIQANFPGKKTGMVYSNTKNFYDARDAFTGAMPGAVLYQVSRSPSQSELAQVAQKICADQTKVAFPLMAPANYIALANQVKGQCGAIQWAGVGVTQGLNAVASTGCQTNQAIDKGIFFSPFPEEDKIESLDPEFKEAVDKYNGGEFDDIYIALWGGIKVAAKMIAAAGKDLTQVGFVKAAETANITTNVFPPLSYSPDNHFGAKQVHVLQLDCAGNNNKYKTLATFASY